MSVPTTADIFASGASLPAIGLFAWLADFNDRMSRSATWPELMNASPDWREVAPALRELEARGFIDRSTTDGFVSYAVAGAGR